MKAVTVTTARKKIFDLIEEVQTPGTYYGISAKGKPTAVLMSFEQYESLIETIEVLQDIPTIIEDLKEARAEIQRGDYYTLEEVLKSDAQFLLSDSKGEISTKHVRSNSVKKSKKKPRKTSSSVSK